MEHRGLVHAQLDGRRPGRQTVYEAESAAPAAARGLATDHAGYSGTGFVDGYGDQGAATTFAVNVPKAGDVRRRACATPTARNPSPAPRR